ncbi:MAG: DUF3021 domain-containing protein [Ruminococcaceae bacterium]|nr:DUF3021 domain-containing protein [Oscillospiraceae bacterium]
MNKQKRPLWKRLLVEEIGIEFKACLYFFCILFYYSMYRLIGGSSVADILHMAEMILLTYAMGYAQFYLMHNFDEAEKLGGKEIFFLIICTALYTAASYIAGWFDKNLAVTAGFFFYIAFVYVCAFLIYKFKRNAEGKILNEDLKAFKERRKNR